MRSGIDALTGQRLSGRDHLRQSIKDILTTPVGSRLMRREYGSLLPELIDQPLNGATRLRAMAATVDAVLRWEPGVKVSSVQFVTDDTGQLVCDLVMTENSADSERLSVPLGLRGVVA